jgi:hypothetical protein
MVINVALTVDRYLPYSKKLKELRSSVTKSGSTPGGFPCVALPPGTIIADEQVVYQNHRFPTIELETVIDMRPYFVKYPGGNSDGSGSTIQLARHM